MVVLSSTDTILRAAEQHEQYVLGSLYDDINRGVFCQNGLEMFSSGYEDTGQIHFFTYSISNILK